MSHCPCIRTFFLKYNEGEVKFKFKNRKMTECIACIIQDAFSVRFKFKCHFYSEVWKLIVTLKLEIKKKYRIHDEGLLLSHLPDIHAKVIFFTHFFNDECFYTRALRWKLTKLYLLHDFENERAYLFLHTINDKIFTQMF